MTQCPHCGCDEIDEDAGRGEATCMGCGTVLEESTIVSEVQFQETAGGGSGLIGQFVAQDRPQPNTLQGIKGIVSQESREVTYFKGKKLIMEVANQLHINQHCIDTAFNFYKMCVCRSLTRGRHRSHVVAACLYMTCRLENTPHLLLDFSDVTQVNVYDLGRTLNFLARTLHINLPSTDPCLYILRFALLLDFGEKQREVVSLATRIVQRMKRDWLSTGRRPTGICGAALLLAARSYNFNRSVSDIVRIVHISESVVRKRLDEFSRTPSANVTIEEFHNIDLEQSEDPPAYREARKKAREQMRKTEDEKAGNAEKEIDVMENQVEKALEVKRKEVYGTRHNQYAKLFLPNTSVAGSSTTRKRTITKSEMPETNSDSIFDQIVQHEIQECVLKSIGSEISISPPDDQDLKPDPTYARPTVKSLGLKRVNTPPHECEVLKEDFDGELDLDGIDDSEIDSYLLTPKESNLKERYWMKMNGEYMAEMEKKRKEKEEEQLKRGDDAPKPKRRVVRKKGAIVASTAHEAMEKVIIEKKLSNKINFDVLKSMETDIRDSSS